MDAQAGKGWSRPDEGRRIAGVALALARRFGLSVVFVRWALVLDAVVGLALVLAFAVFDHALFGGPVGPALRGTLIVLGLAGTLGYPALALLLPDSRSPRRWDFAGAFGAILLLVLVGQALGFLLTPYWRVARASIREGDSGWITWIGTYAEEVGFGGKDIVLGAFFLSAGTFVWLQRAAVYRFFRTMYVGVTLVVGTTVAVGLGVLVPQIDGFEDPEQRVDMAREHADYLEFKRFGYQKLPAELADGHEQYQAFRWAEGYFLYHMLHLYGLGMPQFELSPSQAQALERFGEKYGYEERDNNRKQMVAALTGREKISEIGGFIQANEDTFWRFFQVSTALELNRTYKSSWFASLLFLLGVAVFFNTFKGNPKSWFKIQKLGFFVVHLGLMTLLCGGFVSKLLTDRGILQLDLRAGPQDTYWRHFDPAKKTRLPFAVRLDRFARQDWKSLEVYFPKEDFTSRPPRYTLWEGRTIRLDYVDDGQGGLRPDIELRVLELYDRVDVGLAYVQESDDPQEEGFPVAEILVRNDHPAHAGHDSHAEGTRQHLLSMQGATESYRGETLRDPRGAFRVAAAYGAEPNSHFPAVPDRLGQLQVTVVGEGDGMARSMDIRMGETLELPGGYRVELVDATTDLDITRDRDESLHPLPLAEQPLTLAAVWVDIFPPSSSSAAEETGPRPERRVVLQGIDPVQYGLQERFFHADVVLNLTWDTWTAPGPPRYLLHWGPDTAPVLLSESGETWPLAEDERIPLPGETELTALQFLSRAVSRGNLTFLESEVRADGWDADFYARSPRGAVLEVVRHPATPEETVERVELATAEYAKANLWFAADDEFVLRFVENAEMLPFEWRSVLTILEEDASGQPYEVPLGTEREREIRVNDYFYYRGYRFFQTNARPDMPTYSGIGVVYDPGIPIVLVGMYVIIAGTVIAFLIRPVVLSARGKGANP